MTKIMIDIPQTEYELISKVAEKLGLSVETLMQQEIDQDIITISAWTQRAEMVQ
jgi:hypothetical protein